MTSVVRGTLSSKTFTCASCVRNRSQIYLLGHPLQLIRIDAEASNFARYFSAMSSRRSISPSLTGSSESSEDGSDQEGRISSLENRSGNAFDAEAQSSHHEPQPYSDQKNLANGMGKIGPNPKRPTHFLCFPLVTDTSVPQLAESLKRFREITTTSAKSTQDGAADGTPEREIDDPRATSVNGTSPADIGDDRLKVIPASAHRPPGTFHLTIGTMELSQESDMLRAIRLLKTLDYNSILSKIDQQLSSSTNPREIYLDATSMYSNTIVPQNANTNTSTKPSDPYRNTVSKIDRAILHATPNTSFHAANASQTTSYRDTVSKIDRAIMHATPDTRDSRSPKASASATTQNNANTPATTSKTPSHRTDLSESFSQQQRNSSQESGLSYLTTSSLAPSVAEPSTVHGNRYGVSGYKETVSTIDRYVDKTYDTAQKARMKARGLRPSEMRERMRRRGKSGGAGGNGLDSLKRDVSPPASVATTQRRLLSEDGTSTLNGGDADGGSLYTVTTNRTDATERPNQARAVLPADVLGPLPVTGGSSHPHPHPDHHSTDNVDGDGTAPAAKGASEAKASTTPTSTPAQPQPTPNPLVISLQGLATFPSPSKTRVFYAPPLDPAHRLLLFANGIRQAFLDAGVLRDEGRELVLHATVANMSYVSRRVGGHAGGGKGRGKRRAGHKRAETVDATGVIEFFNAMDRDESGGNAGGGRSRFVWADEILVDTVRICKMGAVKAEGDEEAVLGMVYPAVEVDIDAGSEGGSEADLGVHGKSRKGGGGEKVKAEVVFG